MNRVHTRILTLIPCLIIFLFITTATADQLVWVPINPSFGGSPFNAAWLMQQAEAQKPEEKRITTWYEERGLLEDFTESMNRQILSRLSSRLIQMAFGEMELEPGHYEIGDFVIDISSTDTGISVIITDPITGGKTTIEIPYY